MWYSPVVNSARSSFVDGFGEAIDLGVQLKRNIAEAAQAVGRKLFALDQNFPGPLVAGVAEHVGDLFVVSPIGRT